MAAKTNSHSVDNKTLKLLTFKYLMPHYKTSHQQTTLFSKHNRAIIYTSPKWSTGAFSDLSVGASARLGNFWKSRVRVRQLKNYLKYFYLYFLYIFTIKIFLKSTLLWPWSQKKERRRQETQNKKEITKEATNNNTCNLQVSTNSIQVHAII